MNRAAHHVTSLELSIRLKDRGLPQRNGLFYWIYPKPGTKAVKVGPEDDLLPQLLHHKEAISMATGFELARAFTVSELGLFFPDHYNVSYKRVSRDSKTRCSVDCYDANRDRSWKLYPKRTNQADAYAHMLDLLLDQGVLTVKETPEGHLLDIMTRQITREEAEAINGGPVSEAHRYDEVVLTKAV